MNNLIWDVMELHKIHIFHCKLQLVNPNRDRPKLIFINSAETEMGPKYSDVVSAENETEAEFNILFLADTETETENP